MPPSHKRGVFRTFVHRKKTSPREVESLYHKKSPLVNSCGRFFRIFRRPAEERRGGRENLRRDTPPAHTASGGAARRTVEFVAGYAAHVPGGTASGKTDAAGSRGRIPTSGEGTDNQIPPSVCASRSGLAVCARIYVRIDPAALSSHAVLPVPASGDNVRSRICGKPAVFTPQMERCGYFCKLFCDLRC